MGTAQFSTDSPGTADRSESSLTTVQLPSESVRPCWCREGIGSFLQSLDSLVHVGDGVFLYPLTPIRQVRLLLRREI